jgi:Na+/proline symporter
MRVRPDKVQYPRPDIRAVAVVMAVVVGAARVVLMAAVAAGLVVVTVTMGVAGVVVMASVAVVVMLVTVVVVVTVVRAAGIIHATQDAPKGAFTHVTRDAHVRDNRNN